ncbi:MAG: MgtC/SapB family protein [Candidatus Omnitrophica bacterium]|nr:MgtC/SapB family protein [Candidatus Omnitrophota bacterium]
MVEPALDITIKLVVSVILSSFVGLEREVHGRAAGLRTHILVSLGSCLIMLTSIDMFEQYHAVTSCDPARIAAGVVTGIGFLGAGTILRYRVSVIGLTTAASIWTVAAIGLAVGSGFYWGSIVTTFLTILTLVVINKLEHTLLRKARYRTLVVEAHVDAVLLGKIRALFGEYLAEIKDFEIEKIPETTESRISFDIKLTTATFDDTIIIKLLDLEGVGRAYWD